MSSGLPWTAYDVRLVQDDAELLRLHEMAVSACDPVAQCNSVKPYPTLEQLRNAPSVYAAYADEDPVAFVMCNVRRMIWLTGKPEHLAPACVAIAGVIHREFGQAWGVVENAQLRAAIAAAGPGVAEDDGRCVRWIGE